MDKQHLSVLFMRYLGPVIIRGKILIQKLWKEKSDWDKPITESIENKWKKINGDLADLHLISINRRIGTVKDDFTQIHGFSDASENGAVVYTRTKGQGRFRTELIISKSREAPLKTTTIPRLERCAAKLLADLLK